MWKHPRQQMLSPFRFIPSHWCAHEHKSRFMQYFFTYLISCCTILFLFISRSVHVYFLLQSVLQMYKIEDWGSFSLLLYLKRCWILKHVLLKVSMMKFCSFMHIIIPFFYVFQFDPYWTPKYSKYIHQHTKCLFNDYLKTWEVSVKTVLFSGHSSTTIRLRHIVFSFECINSTSKSPIWYFFPSLNHDKKTIIEIQLNHVYFLHFWHIQKIIYNVRWDRRKDENSKTFIRVRYSSDQEHHFFAD